MNERSSHHLFWIASLGSGFVVAMLTFFFVAVGLVRAPKTSFASATIGWVLIFAGLLMGVALWAHIQQKHALSAGFLAGIFWSIVFIGLLAAAVILVSVI